MVDEMWITRGGVRHFARSAAAVVLVLVALAFVTPMAADAEEAVVSTEGECLRLRAEPSLHAMILSCLAPETVVEIHDEQAEVDGYSWQRILVHGREGWVAANFLGTPPRPAESANALPPPPPGGLTIGRAGISDIAALVAAQPFEVTAIFVFDVAAQQFLTHNVVLAARLGMPPAFSIHSDDVVLVRRNSESTEHTPVNASSASVEGMRNSNGPLPTPPRGGLTVGIAGTTNLDQLIAAQPFAVDLVTMWDIEAQRWLMYRPDAPAFTNSLASGAIDGATPVFLRRHIDAPDPEPPPIAEPPASEPQEERITYYFCEPGENPAWWGDGGGFCGAMANGQIVHNGAASCARHRMGERFQIAGDPTSRTYTCTDTGGAVYDGHRDIWFADSDSGRLWWMEVGPTALVIPVE
ncbi:MAG: SH3 domain-containing protein [Dehalococcoidia bacterium]